MRKKRGTKERGVLRGLEKKKSQLKEERSLSGPKAQGVFVGNACLWT